MTGNDSAFMKASPSDLRNQAKRLGDAIDAFGGVAEALIIKYKKGILAEQCRLMRLADAAMHIYGLACNLSRCTHSIKQGNPTADYEMRLVKVAANLVRSAHFSLLFTVFPMHIL